MTDVCYPPSTDWSCRWTEAELEQQRADSVMGPKIETAEAFAWSLLASLTMYRIGTCPITVRPCAARCAPPGSYRTAVVRGGSTAALPVAEIGRLSPYVSGGVWLNACGCRNATDCGCESLSTVELPGPVGSIVEVRLDGAVLPRSAFRVMNGNRLVRTDGQDWPTCQDMAAPTSGYTPFSGTYGTSGAYTFTRVGDVVTVSITPDAANSLGIALPEHFAPGVFEIEANITGGIMRVQNDEGLPGQPAFMVIRNASPVGPSTFQYLAAPAQPDEVNLADGTFEVTYYRGAAPNRMTNAAAGALANEFLLACDGDASCRLPYNVTSMARQGESYEFEQTDFLEGSTGVPQVDALIRIYNPNRLKAPVIVASPDDYLTPARTA